MNDLEIVEEKVSNMFPPQKLIAEYSDNDGRDDILRLKNPVTGKVCLEIGTDNIDDYYPSCVMNWYPENLPINNML